jgi:prepilin-type N-terminal cleavage/methylation domain-containing protein
MRREPDNAFTVIELMITLTIIAIILGLGAPSLLNALPGLRVSGAARQVLADMRLARVRAVERGTPMGVEFDAPGSSHYLLYRDDDGNDAYSVTDESIKQVTLTDEYENVALKSNDGSAPADGVDLDGAGANGVVFRTNGSASGSGSVYLMPVNDAVTNHDRNRRVRVVAPTGNVRIESYDGTVWE